MKFEFLPEARAELLDAATYYESKEIGLGVRYRNEVAHVIGSIVADPTLWRERSGGYRRVNCPIFPYYIAYFVRAETILIAAVAHARRRPGYWRDRLDG
jgi:plasmid stabilization system protein ParE